MQARTRVAPNRSLTERLARAFTAVSVLIVATLAVTGGCFAVVLQHFEPSVNALIAGRGAIDEVQNGMLDEESGLRGYLDSGDQVFLASYYGGQTGDPAWRQRHDQIGNAAGSRRTGSRDASRAATLVQ